MKKSILISFVLALFGFAAFADPVTVTNFFNFNSWTHREFYGHTGTNWIVTRSLYDNGKYLVRDQNTGHYWNRFSLNVNNGDTYEMPSYIELDKDDCKDFTLHIHEGAGVTESFYNFHLESNNDITVSIEGDGKGEVVSSETVHDKSKIKITYTLKRPDLNEYGEPSGKYEYVRCSDTFFNMDRRQLNSCIVHIFSDTVSSLNDSNYQIDFDETLSPFSKPELRIIRNLVYASHGYIFKSPDLQKLFANEMENYSPKVKNADDIILSDREKQFVEAVQKYEAM